MMQEEMGELRNGEDEDEIEEQLGKADAHFLALDPFAQ